ncbi:MAG: DNA-binding protein [Rhodobacteraceae bacterium]|nr:DNA-binding protein [Paracoccaceae bacterium]
MRPDTLPRLMQASMAARYLGFSESKFRGLGIPHKRHGGNVLWDRLDLDAYADALPYDAAQEETTCAADKAFGS